MQDSVSRAIRLELVANNLLLNYQAASLFNIYMLKILIYRHIETADLVVDESQSYV